MKPVPTLPGHDGKSCRGAGSPKFVLVSLCWEGEGFVPGKKVPHAHFYGAMHQPRRPLATTAHPAVGHKSRYCIKAQASPSSPGPSANTRLLSSTPLNPDETALPFQNPTLRQHIASVATTRPGHALSTAPSPLKTHPGMWRPRPRAVWRGGGGEAGGLAAGGQQAASLGSPSRQKNVFLFPGKCSSTPRAKDNSGSKLLPPTVMEK